MSGSAQRRKAIAIIGGGVAGVISGYHLSKAGFDVTVFEKSRGLGGRLANRRAENELRFDHGAQYFTVRDPKFESLIEESGANAFISHWAPRSKSGKQFDHCFAGVPGMNSWLKHLGNALNVETNSKVETVQEHLGECMLTVNKAEELSVRHFDGAVITAPPPQIKTILGDRHRLISRIENVKMAPCWTIMLAFNRPQDPLRDLGWDVYEPTSGPISWIARNSSKPARREPPECWVAQASAEWSEANLELSPERILGLLMPEISDMIEVETHAIIHKTAHRWRFARVETPANLASLSDDKSLCVLAGDWCLGPRVECAALSGLSASEAIIRKFG